MTNSSSASSIKQQQYHKLLLFSLSIALIVLFVFYMMRGTPASKEKTANVETVHLASPLEHADPEAYWRQHAERQLETQEKETSALQKQLDLLKQKNEGETVEATQTQQEIEQLRAQVTALQNELEQRTVSQGVQSSLPSPSSTPLDAQILPTTFIKDDTVSLTDNRISHPKTPRRTPENYVPAGTVIVAVPIEGADPSAGVNTQANPTPMTFRFIDNGTLPNHYHSHLKDCVATAASTGDISSERGQIRLERLSCVLPNREVLEIPVQATVAGPDGKDGIRGRPLWRNGPVATMAGAAGFMQGIGQGLQTASTRQVATPLGVMQTLSSGKVVQAGVGGGVSGASERIADYWIKLADQYHPVIQISAGQIVDVIVLKGFYLDNFRHSDYEEEPKETPEVSSKPDLLAPDLSSVENTALSPEANVALPLSDDQIQRLKQHNAAQGYGN